jgi:hypothetical protein
LHAVPRVLSRYRLVLCLWISTEQCRPRVRYSNFLVYLLVVRVCLQFLSDHVIVFENRCEVRTKVLDPCTSGKLFTGKVNPTRCETNTSCE